MQLLLYNAKIQLNHHCQQSCLNTNLVDFGLLACESIPQNNGALIVTAGQKVLVVAAPADTAATKNIYIIFPLKDPGYTKSVILFPLFKV